MGLEIIAGKITVRVTLGRAMSVLTMTLICIVVGLNIMLSIAVAATLVCGPGLRLGLVFCTATKNLSASTLIWVGLDLSQVTLVQNKPISTSLQRCHHQYKANNAYDKYGPHDGT